MITTEDIYKNRQKINSLHPLVHCISNAVAANFSANAVLALGAKAIMAEYSGEMSEIVSAAQAVSINMGMISDSKAEAINAAAKAASDCNIPFVVDIVGAACSSFRKNFAKELVSEYRPAVIKGNQAEIFAFCGLPFNAEGIDSEDSENTAYSLKKISDLAEELKTVIFMTGKADIISDGKRTISVENGSSLMPYVTGTGCALGAVTGCFLAAAEPFEAAVSAAVTMGLAGEYAEEFFRKNGSISGFAAGITDGLFSMDKEFFIGKARYFSHAT